MDDWHQVQDPSENSDELTRWLEEANSHLCAVQTKAATSPRHTAEDKRAHEQYREQIAELEKSIDANRDKLKQLQKAGSQLQQAASQTSSEPELQQQVDSLNDENAALLEVLQLTNENTALKDQLRAATTDGPSWASPLIQLPQLQRPSYEDLSPVQGPEAALYRRWMQRCTQSPQKNAATIEAEFQRLKAKLPQAVVCALSYCWDKVRCVSELVEIEARLVERQVPLSKQESVAVRMVLETIEAGWAPAERKLKRAMLLVTKQQSLVDLNSNTEAAIDTWLLNTAQAHKLQLALLTAKFSLAMSTAQKYGWDDRKCRIEFLLAESDMELAGVSLSEQAAAVLEIVKAAVKAGLIRQKQKNWKMRRIMYVIDKNETGSALNAAVAEWVSSARSPAQVEEEASVPLRERKRRMSQDLKAALEVAEDTNPERPIEATEQAVNL